MWFPAYTQLPLSILTSSACHLVLGLGYITHFSLHLNSPSKHQTVHERPAYIIVLFYHHPILKTLVRKLHTVPQINIIPPSRETSDASSFVRSRLEDHRAEVVDHLSFLQTNDAGTMSSTDFVRTSVMDKDKGKEKESEGVMSGAIANDWEGDITGNDYGDQAIGSKSNESPRKTKAIQRVFEHDHAELRIMDPSSQACKAPTIGLVLNDWKSDGIESTKGKSKEKEKHPVMSTALGSKQEDGKHASNGKMVEEVMRDNSGIKLSLGFSDRFVTTSSSAIPCVFF